MAYCSNCGKELVEGAKFCYDCGAPAQPVENERKTIYDGEIHKCPNCGDTIDAYEAVCEACGYEIRGRKATYSDKLSDDGKKRKNSTDLTEKDMAKITLIRSFPIPNTKEDLLEFIIAAAANINITRVEGWDDISHSEVAISEAWQAKLEQAYEKAKVGFSTSVEFEKVQDIYQGVKMAVSKQRKKSKYISITCIVGIILFIVVLWGFIGFDIISDKREIRKENERLNEIVEEIYNEIDVENYTSARIKASSLVFAVSNDYSNDYEEYWDKKRDEIVSVIDNVEGITVDTEITDKDN